MTKRIALTLLAALFCFAEGNTTLSPMDQKLELAFAKGDLGMVRKLLDQGADPTTVLYDAVAFERPDIVRLAISKGADVPAARRSLEPQFPSASRLGRIRAILELGVDINVKDSQGWTALMYAVMFSKDNPRKDEIIRFLLEKKVEVNATDKRGRSTLFYALMTGNEEVARLLIKNGAHKVTFPEPAKTAPK